MKHICLCLVAATLLLSTRSQGQTITSHSVAPIDTSCGGPGIYLTTSTYSSGLFVQTFFGDGTFSWTPVMNAGITGFANITHSYEVSGTYFIRQMLFDGAVAVDSSTETFQYLFCRSVFLSFYNDVNSNGVYEASIDVLLQLPFLLEVDSAGIAVDTIAGTSGMYYKEYGPPGTIYAFKMLTHPSGLAPASPSTGIISDTIHTGGSVQSLIKYAGLTCSGSAFDVAEHVTANSGRHHFNAVVIVNNPYCTAQNATLTMRFSTKYNFSGAVPNPTSVAGNTVTWDLTDLQLSAQKKIDVSLEIPGTWLTPGDTVHTEYTLTTAAGDVNPENNHCNRVDTVKISYDPNYKSVLPEGIVKAGTRLSYAVHFENTGNDTAFNIHVMDTLSDNVDPQSLEITAASAVMNVVRYFDAGHNIVKFDFPGINLPDSSHHGLCDGMVMYSIMTKAGLPVGTKIDNEAGIYFDCNEVVMTNNVENTIGIPAGVTILGNTGNTVAVYPNPANDVLNVRAENGSFSELTICNALGQRLTTQQLTGSVTSIPVSNLSAGIYFVTLKGGQEIKVVKFEKL